MLFHSQIPPNSFTIQVVVSRLFGKRELRERATTRALPWKLMNWQAFNSSLEVRVCNWCYWSRRVCFCMEASPLLCPPL